MNMINDGPYIVLYILVQYRSIDIYTISTRISINLYMIIDIIIY